MRAVYGTIIMRRSMMRLAERVPKTYGLRSSCYKEAWDRWQVRQYMLCTDNTVNMPVSGLYRNGQD